PDDVPNAPMLCWVSWIHLFNFTLNHVSADKHRVEDALSRWPPTSSDEGQHNGQIEDFIDSFLNEARMSCTSSVNAKYLLDSIHTQLSISSTSKWKGFECLPIYKETSSFQIKDVLLCDLFVSQSITNLMVLASSTVEVHPLPDFKIHTMETRSTDEFLLGDKLVELEFSEYEHYTQNITDFTAVTGHHHGKKDQGSAMFWKEI
ncbi:hypothetical protein L218DRAFT_881567, partial [Marasmius fiardii PR-910]